MANAANARPRTARAARVRLSQHERAVLDAIRWLAVKGAGVRAAEIGWRTGQTEQGAALVARSAVRKGLVRRYTGRGHVWFALTDAGWALARPRTAQARRTRRLGSEEENR